MLQATVASSTQADTTLAAREMAKTLKEENLKAAFVYCSCELDVKTLVKELGNELQVPVFGNTSFTGIITPEGYIGGDKPFVGAMGLSDPDLTVGVASISKTGDAVEAGRLLAASAKKAAGKTTAPDYFYMAASPAEEEFYAEGIAD
ncbi:MAG: hypothetical protein HXK85_09160, partial [Lachnospiraceae bacterium]|nr:hypothetical protein [Lachnospiraceae bacterium]